MLALQPPGKLTNGGAGGADGGEPPSGAEESEAEEPRSPGNMDIDNASDHSYYRTL